MPFTFADGLFDFVSLDITPVGVSTCTGDAHCSGLGFDNVVMTAPVTTPILAALPPFVGGLAELRLLARRRKAMVARD